ncbi:hypothetical protein J3R83DRAFT_5207 [Lanmaoa asiatica]|nr:hypothetical protein J3R83DRAFT_5207 [Lanmaoa asiatica]
MSLADPSKQERIEEFLRKSLLGEELINTQFHLFSARSIPSSRLTKPRVLCANNVLLAKSSKYFLDLLSSDINPSDPSMVDLTDGNDVPSNVPIDDYGYGSDSDLDDDDGESPIPIADTVAPKDPSTMVSTLPPHINVMIQPKDDDDSPSAYPPSWTERGSAFRWYTFLNYLYTGKFSFLPLGSAAPGGQPRESSTSSLDEPKCSAKSMYRLACKVGLDHLRDEALAHIRNNLTEQNILKELSCNLVSMHSQLLDMELDVLYTHIASPTVVTGFPALAQRIANKELPHGADIIVGIHARLLKGRHPLPLTPIPPQPPLSPSPSTSSRTPLRPPSSLCGSPTQVTRDPRDAIVLEAEPCHVGGWGEWMQPPAQSSGPAFTEFPVSEPEDYIEPIKKPKMNGNVVKKKKGK